MKRERPWSSLIVAVLLALATAGLLFLVDRMGVFSGLVQVLMIVAGMTAIAAFTGVQRFVESRRPTPLITITFNEALVREGVSEGVEAFEGAPEEEEEVRKSPISPWDLSAAQLVGADNALALAALRMDIERELRRIAYENEIDVRTRPLGIVGLADELVSREILPAAWRGSLREITTVCNKGVHGFEVPDHIAASVVRVGAQILDRLRSRGKRAHTVRLGELESPPEGVREAVDEALEAGREAVLDAFEAGREAFKRERERLTEIGQEETPEREEPL